MIAINDYHYRHGNVHLYALLMYNLPLSPWHPMCLFSTCLPATAAIVVAIFAFIFVEA